MELKRLFLFVQLAAAAIVDYSYTNEAGMLKTSGSPETSDHTCVILRSTEWLAHALIGEAGKIGLQDGTKIFEHPEERRKDDNERHVIIPKPQSGSLATILRAIMIWTQRLDILKSHLVSASDWNTESQLAAGRCYLDYTFQTSEFLKAFNAESSHFHLIHPVRPVVYEKILKLYMSHKHIADVLAGADGITSDLLTNVFPSNLERFWTNREDAPEPGSPISAYVREHDTALNHDFLMIEKVWRATPSLYPGSELLPEIELGNDEKMSGQVKDADEPKGEDEDDEEDNDKATKGERALGAPKATPIDHAVPELAKARQEGKYPAGNRTQTAAPVAEKKKSAVSSKTKTTSSSLKTHASAAKDEATTRPEAPNAGATETQGAGGADSLAVIASIVADILKSQSAGSLSVASTGTVSGKAKATVKPKD